MSEEELMKIIARNEMSEERLIMSEERLMKIIARLVVRMEGKIMDLEESLDRARANAGFWWETAKEWRAEGGTGFHDDADDE